MATLEKILPGALVAARDQVPPASTIGQIAALFGSGPAAVSGLATALVNETGTFKNYASARRNVERYLKAERGEAGQTRRPSAKARAALDVLARSRADVATANAIKRRGLTVDFSGSVIVSPKGRRPDERERDIQGVYLTPEEATPFLDQLLHGNLSEAADDFNADFMAAYGIGNAYITDVDDLDFTIGER